MRALLYIGFFLNGRKRRLKDMTQVLKGNPHNSNIYKLNLKTHHIFNFDLTVIPKLILLMECSNFKIRTFFYLYLV